MSKRHVIQQNTGPIDRVIRFIVGLAFIITPPVVGWAPWTVALVGAGGGALVAESLTGY